MLCLWPNAQRMSSGRGGQARLDPGDIHSIRLLAGAERRPAGGSLIRGALGLRAAERQTFIAVFFHQGPEQNNVDPVRHFSTRLLARHF